MKGKSIGAIIVGKMILQEIRKTNPIEYDKIMNNPIKGCSCGYIKEGDKNLCPQCEDIKKELNA